MTQIMNALFALLATAVFLAPAATAAAAASPDVAPLGICDTGCGTVEVVGPGVVACAGVADTVVTWTCTVYTSTFPLGTVTSGSTSLTAPAAVLAARVGGATIPGCTWGALAANGHVIAHTLITCIE
jgi:hypothetical protein